ncbi:cupin domain-containing protein [Roseovarius sp. SCSIO 43702]|uniref:dimethylsulfonioproprionate lyase family protein n=1 Tax=Roseovarius sp. SCSIO 43702 TaxID=2823043 RepID=UPI001C737356|nr:dimethylsulfonioproprionate lyase family protein [Roseovarius sp. SCSIO 43702]QYX58245.1 cupin domain-containing protein [Roseovarius sp. SCSIO 43702]
MTDPRWQTLLSEARELHARSAALARFCRFPDAPVPRALEPHHDPLCDAMQSAGTLPAPGCEAFRDALIAAAPLAQWRDTYRHTPIGAELHRHFGCFEILGRDAPFATDEMRGFLVYQLPGYHYPLHRHPAEELYLVVAGEAEFHLDGRPSRILRAGETIYHPSNAPHALTTHRSAVLAYVLWRGEMTTPPVFT